MLDSDTNEDRYWVAPGSDASKAPAGSTFLGVHYPRGATVGGSSMVNAMCTWLPPDSDWNYIQNITGDASWSADNMRKIFERIEKNNYLPKGTAGHGFNGYFQTNMNKPASIGQPVLGIAQAIAQNFSYSTAQADILTRMGSDANYLDPQRDWTTGIFGLPQHTKANGDRYSSRDYIQDTIQKKFPLKLSTTSLATRVLFDLNSTSCGGVPRATGIEYLQGKSIYKADARYTPSNKGTLKTATARKEVILSGGTFNTPQLLMLSGIGPKEHLSHFNIPVIVDAPGVGRNLMDNQEMPIIGQFQGQSSGFTQPIIMMKTKHSPDGERDMFVMQGPFAFRGFWPSNQSTSHPLTSTSSPPSFLSLQKILLTPFPSQHGPQTRPPQHLRHQHGESQAPEPRRVRQARFRGPDRRAGNQLYAFRRGERDGYGRYEGYGCLGEEDVRRGERCECEDGGAAL